MSRIAIAFFILFSAWGLGAKEKAFWEKPSQSLDKKLEDRSIPVSVKSVPAGDNRHHLRLQGIGEVSAPFIYTKQWTANFNQLARVSTYVREVKWDQSSKVLYLHTEAFNFHARMRLKIKQEDEKKTRDLKFEVIQGVFTGMKGSLKVHQHGFAKSRVSIDAHYYYSKWSIPELFLEFGLEVVLQKFAERLRALIEKDFKEAKVPGLEKTQ